MNNLSVGSTVKFVSAKKFCITDFVQKNSSIAKSILANDLARQLIHTAALECEWKIKIIGEKVILDTETFRRKLAEVKKNCQCFSAKAFITKVIRFFCEKQNNFIARREYLELI